MKRLSNRSWDLERGDTFELVLMSRDCDNHELFIAYHHILMDLVGPGIIMRDLNTSYQMKLLDRSVDSVAVHDETRVAHAIEVGCGPVVKFGQETVLQRSSLGFDLSLIHIFCALANGGRLIIAPSDLRRDPTALSDLLSREQVTLTIATPSEYLA
ncbi:hypothetical protein NXS19_010664 [Fusarium pseudograminearum]|nr:hypothetical protein NXS19_010664 [Fusarium pseudograminearum]